METVDTHYLDDGRGFNRGQPTRCIRIDDPSDYDALLAHIIDTDFYGSGYHEHQSGQREGLLMSQFWPVAEMARALAPRRAVEVGCGRGDVLRILHECYGIDVGGVDFVDMPWPSLRGRIEAGDMTDVLERLATERPGHVADTFLGFDIWEHLHPERLGPSLDAMVAGATADALFLFVIPAFGEDRNFGEIFPLELEENRAAFDADQPFTHLIVDRLREDVPAAGHLTWATTRWWEQQFTERGLVRCDAVESALHEEFDPVLLPSVRAFYVFRRPTDAAAARVDALGRDGVSTAFRWRMIAELGRAGRRGIAFDRPFRAEMLDHALSRPGAAGVAGRGALGLWRGGARLRSVATDAALTTRDVVRGRRPPPWVSESRPDR